MARVFIEETTLTDIADAIREKSGLEDLIATGDMAAEIRNIETGGGGSDEEYFTNEDLVLTGDLGAVGNLSDKIWDKIIDNDADKITFNNISGGCNLFNNLENGKDLSVLDTMRFTNDSSASNLFCGTSAGWLPKITGGFNDIGNWFSQARYLRYLPDMSEVDFEPLHNNGGCWMCWLFVDCHSLREVPEELLKELWHIPDEGMGVYEALYNFTFRYCYSLDEVVGLPVLEKTTDENMFDATFDGCSRLARMKFDTNEDGTPKTANWANQVIDLSQKVGYALGCETYIIDYNSGITEENEVSITAGAKLPESYTSLFTDGVMTNKDWYTADNEHSSRYNKWSAIETINSLPDTSEYVAQNGATNTIKFKKNSGHSTVHKPDGTAAVALTSTVPSSFLEKNSFGGIYNLSEEEIAVAAAKGWTVAFVN